MKIGKVRIRFKSVQISVLRFLALKTQSDIIVNYYTTISSQGIVEVRMADLMAPRPPAATRRSDVRHLQKCKGCDWCNLLIQWYSGCEECGKVRLLQELNYNEAEGFHLCDKCLKATTRQLKLQTA